MNNTNPLFLSPTKGQGKDKDFEAQKDIVFASFLNQPSTMLMVSVSTGIMRSNITWFVREWRKQGSIFLLHKSICPISKTKAGFYTTDKSKFPLTSPTQLNLFEL